MPAFIKTPKDEAKWSKMKEQVSKERGKPESKFTDKDWALTNYLWHKSEEMEKSNKDYSIGVHKPTGVAQGKGMSQAGFDTRMGHDARAKNTSKISHEDIAIADEKHAKDAHKKVLSEIKSIKPKMVKSIVMPNTTIDKSSAVTSPMKAGSTAVKMPKPKKLADPFASPAKFFKSEDFSHVKHPTIEKLRYFLQKTREKK